MNAKTTKKRTDAASAAADILNRPYARLIVPEEDGSFYAAIQEFPGCFATGDSEAEALASLKDVAESWIQSMLETGQAIPEPTEQIEYSGKLMLRLAKSLHKKASNAAARDGVSLNQFISNCISECVGVRMGTHVHMGAFQQITVLGSAPVSFQQIGGFTNLQGAGHHQLNAPQVAPLRGIAHAGS